MRSTAPLLLCLALVVLSGCAAYQPPQAASTPITEKTTADRPDDGGESIGTVLGRSEACERALAEVDDSEGIYACNDGGLEKRGFRSRTTDETYGVVIEPNVRYYVKNTPHQEWEYYETNKNGHRDTFNSGDETTVVLGDSIAEGRLVSNNETFVHHLDRADNSTAFRNFAIGGFGTNDEIAKYRKVSSVVGHDRVVLEYHTSDPRNNAPDRDLDEQLSITRQSLSTLRSEVAENDADMVIIFVPSKKKLHAQSNGDLEEHAALLAQRRMVTEFAANNPDVELLDMTSAFRSERKQGNRIYGIDDGHVDDYGHSVIARETGPFLRSHQSD